MFRRICIYNNKLFLILDGYLVVYQYQKNLKSEDEKFSECFAFKLPVKGTSVFDANLDVTDNYVTGLKSLVIFLSDTSGHNIFIYSDAFRKKLHQINLPAFSLGIKDKLFVSGGPTFLFHSKNAFHVYPLPYCGNGLEYRNYTDFTYPFSGYKEFKVLQFICVGPFKKFYPLCLFLLVISCNFSSDPSLKILGFFSGTNNFVANFEQLNINVFFPQFYETILKAVEITKAIPHLKTDLLKVESMEWDETATVLCTENECLFFSNSELQFCCKLTIPLTNLMLMKSNFTSMFSGNINIVLTFENKLVFFIEMKQNRNIEVIKQWTDTEAAVGDILMKGSKQVLLLKQTDLNFWQKNVILYDMLSFMPIDTLYHSSVPDNCLKATISGLERKVQIGKSAIGDTEVEISQKSAATADALIKLNEYKVTAENLKLSNTFQESLVDLILSKDENKPESVVTESESTVKLLEEKHRFINNQWVISLCFMNVKERCICYPAAKVLKRNSQLACIQKLFVCCSDDSVLSGECGREINAKSKFYILLNIENLVFQTEDDIFMILSWYDGSTDEFDNEVFTKEDKKILTQNQIYLQTRINLSDIFKQNIQKGISSLSDLLFIRSLQQVTNLSVSSLHSDISRFEDILMKNDIKCLYLLENSSTKCVIFNSDTSPLFGIHFILMKATPNVVKIRTFVRNGSDICLLVHYLYEHLPKDVLISPHMKLDDYAEVKKNLALCMKSEIDLLMSSFNIHNISEEMRKSYIKAMSSQTVGTLTISKINYHRIRTVLVKKECITDTFFKNMTPNSYLF